MMALGRGGGTLLLHYFMTVDRNRFRLVRGGNDYSEQAYWPSLQIKFAYAGGRWSSPSRVPTPFTDRQCS